MTKRQNKTAKQSIRLVFSDLEALRERSPKNVSYAIREAISLYIKQPTPNKSQSILRQEVRIN